MKIVRLFPFVVAMSLGACATSNEVTEDIEWSAQWFQCDSRFQCTAVYDAYCKYVGVNTNYLRVYQDWARQQVERSGELIPCEPIGEDRPLAAYCRQQRCEYP